MSYYELCIEERATIQVSLAQGLSIRKVAALLERSPATISREIRRNGSSDGRYRTLHAVMTVVDQGANCFRVALGSP